MTATRIPLAAAMRQGSRRVRGASVAWSLALLATGCAKSSSGIPPAPRGASASVSRYAPVNVPPGDTSRVLRLRVPSAALAGNLLGDSATRNVIVYVPPDYATSGTKRYRTLYLLHGFGAKRDGQNSWIRGYRGFHLGHTKDSLYTAGAVRDLIVIAPDGTNFWSGSFYRDSPVAGGWETFITRELVGTIDATFRTIADRNSRGLAGHSMGGYGTLSIIAKHPDIYGAAYAMSPCCVAPSSEAGALADVWKFIATAPSRQAVADAGFYQQVFASLATVYAPNPSKPPLYFDAPFVLQNGTLVPDARVIDRWQAASPLRLLDSLSASLRTLRGLAFDAGRADGFRDIPVMVPRLDTLLMRKGVPHHAELYDGDHSNRIGTRMPTIVLPFFEKALAR